MFDFLYSQEGKMRRSAAQWLEMAGRVRDYRRDQLNEPQLLKLQAATGELEARLKDKAGVPVLTKAIEKLETVMREVGGRIYPATSLVENVDFFLVAAIVILGMRAYFVQPFKIPTNSMWPTYYGMTSEVFSPGEEPNLPVRALRLLTLGASNYTLKAPADGEVMVPVFRNGVVAHSERPGRTLVVFPALMHEYVLSVGGESVQLKVPAEWAQSPDFGFDSVISRTFFGGDRAGLFSALQAAANTRKLVSSTMPVTIDGHSGDIGVYWVSTGRKVRKGDPILSFDILTGDMLFVDRLTYNFFPPKVGSGFVFKTDNIKSDDMKDRSGAQINQYYIKRLVGVPGDRLEIRKPGTQIADGAAGSLGATDGQLYRNGQPIDGAEAFGKNARKDGLYPGYTARGQLDFGQVVEVPGNSYYAMGDNSPNSKDSRYWGFVPDKDAVGRPLFIYYPITKRWGLAK